MSDTTTTRLSKIARELNVGISTIVEFLHKKGVKIDSNPNEKITSEQVDMLLKEFSSDLNVKKESEKLNLRNKREKLETISIGDIHHEKESETQEFEEELLVKDLRATAHHETEIEHPVERETIKLNVIGKIDVDKFNAPKKATVPPSREEKPVIPAEPPKAPEPEVKEEPKPPVAEPAEPAINEVETKEAVPVVPEEPPVRPEDAVFKQEIKDVEVKVVGKIDLEAMNQRTRPPKKTREQLEVERR